MKPDSYPPTPIIPWEAIVPRLLLPIYPPPEPLVPLERPSLPTKQRTVSFSTPYDLSTHIIPACYLRTGRFVPIPPAPAGNLSKEERARVQAQYRHELRVERGPMITDGHPKVLWNCVNRYVRKGISRSNGSGLTLFFAHANGFPKEVRLFNPGLRLMLTFASDLGAYSGRCAFTNGDYTY